MRRIATAVVAATVASLAMASASHAETIGGVHQVSSDIPPRIDRQIGFIPVNGMGRLAPFRAYVGRGQWVRGPWVNFTLSGRTLSESLKLLRRRNWVGHGAFSDRRLTRAERRAFVQVADFGRDADVLVVQKGHPACAGLTLAQARSIAAGRTTSWSQVGATPPGAADRIALRHVRFSRGYIEPRFGARFKLAAGKATPDGGIAEAGRDGAVAGITSWSRARFRSDVCRVPIGGVAPTDVSVHGLTYPAAYPIGFVAPKRVLRKRYEGGLVRRFAKYFESEAAAKLLRGTGMLMAADTPQPPTPNGPPSPPAEEGEPTPSGPAQDYQGRPITSARDDAGAVAELTGERFQQSFGAAFDRLVFDPDSIFHSVRDPGDGTCSTTTGAWSVLEGWRHEENGGGYIMVVRLDAGGSASDSTIELSGDAPDTAWVNGAPYTRSPDLTAAC